MHLFAARIVLLAYLVGGLAIPAMHQHGLGKHAAGHVHPGHLRAGHSPAGECQRAEGCCHTTPPVACDDSVEESAAGDRGPTRTAVAATVPHDATCDDDCVICGFLGSAQVSVADAPPMLVPEPLRRIAAVPQGPGFNAADLRIDRLRGPPLGVILG